MKHSRHHGRSLHTEMPGKMSHSKTSAMPGIKKDMVKSKMKMAKMPKSKGSKMPHMAKSDYD